jgi:hypothetical protein
MDNPESLQGNRPSLRDAVENMNKTGSQSQVFKNITGFIMIQSMAKAGIKKHGQVAIDALYREFLQLDDMDVFQASTSRT